MRKFYQECGALILDTINGNRSLMGRDKVLLLPRNQRILVVLGEDIGLARLRRKLSSAMVAERDNISRSTLLAIERGSTGVSIGAILQVFFVLGLEKDMLKVASDDQLGRKLQDIGLTVKSERQN